MLEAANDCEAGSIFISASGETGGASGLDETAKALPSAANRTIEIVR